MLPLPCLQERVVPCINTGRMGDVPRQTTLRPVSSISNAPISHDSFFIFVFFPEIAKLASILCADREIKQVCHCETFASRRSLFSGALFFIRENVLQNCLLQLLKHQEYDVRASTIAIWNYITFSIYFIETIFYIVAVISSGDKCWVEISAFVRLCRSVLRLKYSPTLNCVSALKRLLN